MELLNEKSFWLRRSHSGSGYATGIPVTTDHLIIPAPRTPISFVSIHVGLSRVQANYDQGPFGASAGIMKLGTKDFGNDPADWQPSAIGKINAWTTAFQVNKGSMSAWEFFQVFG
jgi:hypothetical protein